MLNVSLGDFQNYPISQWFRRFLQPNILFHDEKYRKKALETFFLHFKVQDLGVTQITFKSRF
jgi:hypothetical protein